MSAMKKDDENQVVVHEIPIYLNQSFDDILSLYSFMSGGDVLSLPGTSIISATVQENTHEINLEIERDVGSSNFNKSKSEQFAVNMEGCTSEKLLDRTTYVSHSLKRNSIALGVFQDGELHLTPVDDVFCFRPSLKYIDKTDKRLKLVDSDDLVDDDEDDIKQVTVKFARQESERAKRSREASYSFLKKQQEKLVRFPAAFFSQDSSESHLHFRKLFCIKTDENAVQRDLAMDQFKSSLQELGDCFHGLTLENIMGIGNLSERVRIILLRTRLIQFGTLMHLLSIEANDRLKLVQIVQQIAVLVQGCWVLQSDLIFPKTLTEHGLSSAFMRNARDYLLYLFTRNRTIPRKKLSDMVKLPHHVVQSLLEEVAEFKSKSKEWEFRLATDVDFLSTYPEVVQRQAVKWDMRHEQMVEALRHPEAVGVVASPPQTGSGRQRRKSFRDSFSSDNESGAESHRRGIVVSGKKQRKHRPSFSLLDSNLQPSNKV